MENFEEELTVPEISDMTNLENYIVSEKLKDSHTIDLSALKSNSIEGIA